MNYLAASISGNKTRTTLGIRLERSNINIQISSDSFMINIFDVMLEISKPFMDRNKPNVFLFLFFKVLFFFF